MATDLWTKKFSGCHRFNDMTTADVHLRWVKLMFWSAHTMFSFWAYSLLLLVLLKSNKVIFSFRSCIFYTIWAKIAIRFFHVFSTLAAHVRNCNVRCDAYFLKKIFHSRIGHSIAQILLRIDNVTTKQYNEMCRLDRLQFNTD